MRTDPTPSSSESGDVPVEPVFAVDHDPALEALFEGEGVCSEVGANTPFLLRGESALWWIRSGAIDVFAVALEGAAPVGRRYHVARFGPGRAVWAFEHRPDTAPSALLAVPVHGTVVERLPHDALRDQLRDGRHSAAIGRLLDDWVEALSDAVSHESPVGTLQPLVPGESREFDAGQCAGPTRGTIWTRPTANGALYLDRTPLAPDGFFPLAERTWLRTVEAIELTTLSTAALLEADPRLAGVRGFDQALRALLHDDTVSARERERVDLRERADADKATLRHAVRSLTGVLDRPGTEPIVPEPGADPVYQAARHVGSDLGVRIVLPVAGAAGISNSDRVAEIARASRVRVRQVVLRGAWWERDHGPLLGSVEATQAPVALIPLSARRYEIIDPVAGTRRPVTPEIAETLSPFAMVFHEPLPPGGVSGTALLKFALEGRGRDLWTIVLMGVAGGLLGLVTPVAVGYLVDTIIPESRRVQLVELTLALVVSALSVGLFSLVRSIAVLRVESAANMRVQSGIWDRLLNLPPSFFRNFTSGDLAVRALGVNAIRKVVSGVVASTLVSGIFGVFHFALLFYYSWKLALLAVVLSTVLVGMTVIIGLYSLRFQRRLAEIEGSVSGLVLQLITGISKLRVAGAEERAFATWADAFAEKKRVAFRAGTIQNILATVNGVFPVLATAAVFWLALSLIRGDGQVLTTGDFLAFNASFGTFLGTALSMALAALAALAIVPLYRRIEPILEAVPEVSESKSAPGDLSGEVEVSQLSFRYEAEGPHVLESVSLHVPAGGYVALVGPSGSGKSTLLRLLLGFEQADTGSIYYDGQDLQELDVAAVRRQMGIVLQFSGFRDGSLYENIVGSTPLTVDDAWEAARMAGLAADIEQMPMGMHTRIDSAGVTLSGGQRQRLMIARAMVRRPRFLFFDEATSALDTRTQSIVSESLDRLQATRIVIAHRLSTVVHAHRIHVMNEGRMVDEGTYEELLARPGLFQELAKRQLA